MVNYGMLECEECGKRFQGNLGEIVKLCSECFNSKKELEEDVIKLKIISDGTPIGTKILDIKSNKILSNVVELEVNIKADGAFNECKLHVIDIPIELEFTDPEILNYEVKHKSQEEINQDAINNVKSPEEMLEDSKKLLKGDPPTKITMGKQMNESSNELNLEED